MIFSSKKAKPVINKKNMPEKSQQKLYNFTMLSVMPRMLKVWKENNDRIKYFLEKEGMKRWYVHRIREAAYKGDWLSIILFSIIILYREEKIDVKKD